MKKYKSLVLTALTPQAVFDSNVFEAAALFLRGLNVSVIEFYTPFEQAKAYGDILRKLGMSGVYLGAIYQKRTNSSLTSLDNGARKDALDICKRCVDAASEAQCPLLLTGGVYPEDAALERASLDAFESAMSDILCYAGESLDILLEPGDRAVQFNQLIGPTPLAVASAMRLRKLSGRLFLTMDTSHIAELDEDAETSLRIAAPVCKHVHLANCVLVPGDSMYGDRHPYFGQANGVYSSGEIKSVYDSLDSIFEGYQDCITVSLEVITKDEEPYDTSLQRIVENVPWFFQ